MVRLDGTGFIKPKNRKETIALHATLLNSFFGLSADKGKRIKKVRKIKSWQLPNISLPGLRAVSRHNKRIDERRIADLERRLEGRDRCAEEHANAGRPGKAIKMLFRKKGVLRELRRLRKAA